MTKQPYRYHYWSTEEFATLLTMVGEGRTANQIAERLGRPFASVQGKLRRHGIKMRGRPKKKRTKHIDIFLTEDEFAILKRRAGETPPHRYIRVVLFGNQTR